MALSLVLFFRTEGPVFLLVERFLETLTDCRGCRTRVGAFDLPRRTLVGGGIKAAGSVVGEVELRLCFKDPALLIRACDRPRDLDRFNLVDAAKLPLDWCNTLWVKTWCEPSDGRLSCR